MSDPNTENPRPDDAIAATDAQIEEILAAEAAGRPSEFVPGTVVQAQAPIGIPTLTGADDLAAVIARPLARLSWPDGSLGILGGDILVVSAKAVSRSEGRFVVDPARGQNPAPNDGMSRLEVRDGVALARPLDPDASARSLRVGLQARLGPRVGVLIAASFPSPLAAGRDPGGPGEPGAPVGDIALGAAGLRLTEDHRGKVDEHGREATRTVRDAANALTAFAALLSGTLAHTPVVVIRGLGHLTQHDHGAGILGRRL